MAHVRLNVRTLCLSAVTILVAASAGTALSRLRDGRATNGVTQSIPAALLNGWDADYIWVDRKVSARVWPSGFDAGDDPIATASGVLEFPDNRLGNGFQVPAGKIAYGRITFPSDFDVRGHIRNGYELQLVVRVVPRGFHSADFPFRIGPDVQFGNAYGQMFLNRHGQPDTVFLTYKP